MTTDIIIYHNPECGTSRNTLAMIRNAGIEPHVIEYLKTPPSRALLEQLIGRAGITPRALLREKGTPFADLGLGDESLDDDALIDAMMAHPILINRPLRSEEHTSELQSLMRISYAVFCLKKKTNKQTTSN